MPTPVLSPAQIEQFRLQGHAITGVLFDAATMAKVRAAFEGVWQTVNAQPDAIYRVRGNLFPSGLHRLNPDLAAFCRHGVFAQLCRELIGPDADQVWNQAIIKPGQTGGHFGWHQDARYAITDPLDDGFTCWLAVTQTTIANGTLWAAPDYFGRGLLPHDFDAQHREWQCRFDGAPEPGRKCAIELQPGQMLVFSRLVPHASGPNSTDQPRMAYQLGYMTPGLKAKETGQPFGDAVPILRAGKHITA